MYQATTKGIQVSVTPAYLEQQSEPGEGRWVWAYTIEIENMGESTVQLIDRYWHITDAKGRVQEVSGPGVVGEQPASPIRRAARSRPPPASCGAISACRSAAPACASWSRCRPSPWTARTNAGR